jgi:hypothetical protein
MCKYFNKIVDFVLVWYRIWFMKTARPSKPA